MARRCLRLHPYEPDRCAICRDWRDRHRSDPTPAVKIPPAELARPPGPFLDREITTRHLLYHLWPVTASCWRWNVEQLKALFPLINGKRVVAVVVDADTEGLDEIKAAFGDERIDEFIVHPNVPALREVATFHALFSRVQTEDPGSATLYCHAKGVSRGLTEPVRRWIEAMYSSCSNWPLVSRVLCEYPLAGSFKKIGSCFALSRSRWHYSGAYFWFRNQPVFARDWKIIDYAWYGIESWPSLHFAVEEAGVLIRTGTQETMDLYEASAWT